MINFEELQVGQEIGMDLSPSSISYHGLRIAKVTKITKTQLTTDNGRKFRRTDGRELKSANVSYPNAILRNVKFVNKMREEDQIRANVSREVKEIKDILEGHRNSRGDTFISQTTKDQLLSIVQNLTVNQQS
jgi:hypothetical protein